MNSRTRRLLFSSGALMVVLVAVTIFLNRGNAPPESGGEDGEKKAALSAIQTGLKRNHQKGPVLVEPVEATPFNLLTGKTMLAVTQEQIDRVLASEGYPLDGLIAAQALSGDHRYLREAAEGHAGDAKVQFWILAKRVLPDERAQWLERFKATDPDNALANFLAAEQAFRANDLEAGIAELRAASGKGYRDYSDELRKDVASLYGSIQLFDQDSIRDGSARAISMPHVEQVQALSQQLIEQHRRLEENGEGEAAAEIAALGMEMLETVAGNGGGDGGGDAIGARTMMLFTQEELQRAAGDPTGILADLTTERRRLAQLGEQLRMVFTREDLLDPSHLDGYAERLHDLGEVGAAEWLLEQVGDVPAVTE